MNRKLLEVAIKKSGYKTSYLYSELGLSKQSWYNKVNDKTEFTSTEISKLKLLLSLTPEEVEKIFLG